MPYRDQAEVRAAIDSRRAQWIAAINAGDADGFVTVLTDDAVWLPWQQPAISGKERIRVWLSVPFADFRYNYSVREVSVRVAGDWVVEHAHFRTRAVTERGNTAPAHDGKYTILWRHTASGGWLIERYIDHTGHDAT